jgi:hypothetical protein
MSSTKIEHKAVYDLAKKELKSRTEIKLDSGCKVYHTYDAAKAASECSTSHYGFPSTLHCCCRLA